MIDKKNLPRHIAIIMDGNGRWAKKRHLPRLLGHRQGAQNVDRITETCAALGIEALTLYSFSTENWKRSQDEISGLMDILYEYLKKKYPKFKKNNIRLNTIGRLDMLPLVARDKLIEVIEKTSSHTGMVLTLALSYGARQEIVDATKKIIGEVKEGRLSLDDIDEEVFSSFLYTKGLPDVDLLIRTSGEMRISNFLLWQLSYAEIIFTKVLWPDFSKEDLYAAIEDYQGRERRFGARLS